MSSQLDRLLSMLQRVKQSGRGYYAMCPAHDGKQPKLFVTEKDDGKVTVHCYHGCRSSEVVAALGLTFSDLFPPKIEYRKGMHRSPPKRPLRRYIDEQGQYIIWLSALDWGLTHALGGYAQVRDQIETNIRYQKYGPRMAPRPNLKDRPPQWAVDARDATC